jgi:hypothetical protein
MNQTNLLLENESKSSAEKSILHSIMMLAPYRDVPIEGNSEFDQKDYISGEKEFYSFMKALYIDMYHNPAKYSIPTTEYDEYMKNRKPKIGVEKAHYTDTKECNLRNRFQQSIQFYPRFFYELGLRTEKIRKSDYALVLSIDKYEEVVKSLDWTHIRKENIERYNAINALGIETVQSEDKYYIISKNYPKMFLGLWVLCSAPESKYKYMNYLRLDYKGYNRTVPDIEDIKETLSDDHRKVIDLLQLVLKDLKMKVKVKPLRNITSGSRWKVEYSLKGKNIFGFYGDPDYLMICIYFNNEKNISDMSEKLEKKDLRIFEWFCSKFPERLCKCPSNRAVTFGQAKRRICGLSNRAEVINPNSEDVENSIRVMQIFRNI